jgi:FlaA1/EpsC-like NDP-sugar epimerase
MDTKYDEWFGKTVLITGGTGFMGSLLIKTLLENTGVERVVSISRQWNGSEKLQKKIDDSRLVTKNGCISDKDFLRRAFNTYNPDRVIHAAAYKSVPSGEENTNEIKKVNIDGLENILDVAREFDTIDFCFISSDKACEAVNAYGRSKAFGESMVSSYNDYRFKALSVRYGNVVGSTGAVFDVFDASDEYTVTNPDMTRFWFRPESAASFVLDSFSRSIGGEVFVPELSSSTMGDLVNAFNRISKKEIKVIGSRGGEKIHEKMISADEIDKTIYLPNAYGSKGVFSIEPTEFIANEHKKVAAIDVLNDKEFTSFNADRYTDEQLDILLHDYLKFKRDN